MVFESNISKATKFSNNIIATFESILADFFRGKNLALIEGEMVHFKYAKLIEPFIYELSGFLRGR